MIAAPDLSAIQLHVPLPVMHRARQTFDGPVLEDIEGETRRQVRRFAETIKPGARIAITAGSRGIANIARVIRSIGDEVRALGADPFVMPAMGSHGKATAEGQIEMLGELGITEQSDQHADHLRHGGPPGRRGRRVRHAGLRRRDGAGG